MLIGIDASRAFHSAPTGTETYSHELIPALVRAGTSLRFRLYTDTDPPPEFPCPRSNCEIRSIPFPRLWTHLRLSAEMLVHPPDLLFVPSHVLPLARPRRSLVTVHDLGYLHFPRAHPLRSRLYLDLSTRWNARAAETVIADSAATRQDLIHFYRVDEGKIHVVYPALPRTFSVEVPTIAEIDQAKSHYSLAGEYIITVGTVHPRKNYERLIRAFKPLSAQYELVMVGKKGWMHQEIERAVEGLSLTGRVKLLDYVPAADMRGLYAGARLSVFPSLYEGFGFPILEAQASGTAVACSNVSSLPEVAGAAAEYFDPLDIGGIRAAMTNILQDDARRAQLIALGRANLERFSWDRAATEILSLISPS